MKYPRIEELGIEVRFDKIRRFWPDFSDDDWIYANDLFHRLSDLGLVNKFSAEIGGRSWVQFALCMANNGTVKMPIYAVDVEAALERCMSGRVVEV